MIKDARPGTLLTQAAKTLERLGIEQIDLLYLHAPDPNVPIEESAEAMAEICRRGWARYAGVCNVDLPQLQRFVSVCPVIAVQTYFNMFQQDSVHLLQGFCSTKDIAIVGYWILMKGMLAGQMARDHTFEPSDRRLTYPIYQGERWKKAQDLLDALRPIARQCDLSVAQLVIAWALAQPGLSVALVGAKRPEQIQETANSMRRTIPVETLNTIDGLLANP
jgi:aryl-alcohol dehydrogenase-like predicted oxidoreductase